MNPQKFGTNTKLTDIARMKHERCCDFVRPGHTDNTKKDILICL